MTENEMLNMRCWLQIALERAGGSLLDIDCSDDFSKGILSVTIDGSAHTVTIREGQVEENGL